jgi:serine/threonine protein phosphatase PrpC
VKNCSLFAVYDGHGGDECCNKLKEAFHRYLLRDFQFENYKEHINKQCLKFDEDFAEKVKSDKIKRISGSCAVTLLIMGKLQKPMNNIP